MNRLASETSPYLRQHAHNPVDWYPWGDEAFARARLENRPVFLSVGYSACHWCHVMAHESFEDEQTAKELNDRFVSIKVDREERPDVDAVYMEAVQALTGAGGWPMTVFLTPDGRPFFGGTYFPPGDVHGMPSFRRVLDAVDDAWHNRRDEVDTQADALAEAIGRRTRAPQDLMTRADEEHDAGPATRAAALLDSAVAALAARFDATWGGFGAAPKFPQAQLVELCLRHHRATGAESSLEMATTTLGAMAAGGIYDHLGGGFARYSTDATWTVPHFEKMLYDQAGLVRAYLHAWQVTAEPRWRQVVEETIHYVLTVLASPGGGLCSAQDADSEGEEGRFYVWTAAELSAAAGDLAAVASDWYGVTDTGNFEGRTILRRPLGATLARPSDVEEARRLLFEARRTRVHPGLDDKVLTEWNAMFGSSLAEAAAATGRQDWAEAAVGIGEFLLGELRVAETGRWLRSWQEGRARHLAYAGDYAWLVELFTRLAELTGKPVWLERGRETALAMLDLFSGEGTLLYTTGNDAERLVIRPMDILDGAVPAANGVAAAALLRLGALLADDALTDAGEALLEALRRVAAEHPLACANSVAACELSDGGISEVVITGERPDLLATARARFEPTMVLAWGEPTPSPLWAQRDDGLAYVCRRYVCHAPAATPADLLQRLDDELAAGRSPIAPARP